MVRSNCRLVESGSHTPVGSPPASRLSFSALSSRSSDAMLLSGSSLNDDSPSLTNKPLPEPPKPCELIDFDVLNLEYVLAGNTNMTTRRPSTILEVDPSSSSYLSFSSPEKSGHRTPRQGDYKNIGRKNENKLEGLLNHKDGGDNLEKESTKKHTSLWELKEALEGLQCDKDYIATLLTSAYAHGKTADLTYVRLKLD
ncbi:hypothetical protein TWF730_007303 [Orbilia blumenaviensis]|uniref:Uncharacterized protein n=1 Tax=Orbilia blumenaviensis TaxID=1796055 RepID=A0AAV9V971_9PEZI